MPRNPRSNLGQLIKDECVRRFESVITEEKRQYDQTVRCQDEKLNQLYERFASFIEEFQKEKLQTKDYYIKSKEDFDNAVKSIENNYENLTKFIRQNKNELKKVRDSLEQRIEDFVENKNFQSLYVELEDKIDQIDVKMHILSTYHEKELHKNDKKNLEMFDQISNRINEFTKNTDQRLFDFQKQIDEYVVNAKGVLKELQVYKKEVYIQEKKIEHLYIQIERLKSERG